MIYISYQWARGILWPQYEWIFLLNLRQLLDKNFISDVRQSAATTLGQLDEKTETTALFFLEKWLTQEVNQANNYFLTASAYIALQKEMTVSITYYREKNHYYLLGYAGKERIERSLTPEQAQLLRHVLPKAYALMQTKPLHKIAKYLTKYVKTFPLITRDPLMRDSRW